MPLKFIAAVRNQLFGSLLWGNKEGIITLRTQYNRRPHPTCFCKQGTELESGRSQAAYHKRRPQDEVYSDAHMSQTETEQYQHLRTFNFM